MEANPADGCTNRKIWSGPVFFISRVSASGAIAGQLFNPDYLIVDVPVDSWTVDLTVNLPVLYSYSSFKFLSLTNVAVERDIWTFEDGLNEIMIGIYPVGKPPSNIGQFNKPKKYTITSLSSRWAFIDSNITEFHCDTGVFYKQNACWNTPPSSSITLGGLTFTAGVV